MEDFENQFTETENDPAAGIRRTLMALVEAWPDVLATWDGMIKQAIEHGWEPLAARALVLSTVTGDNLSIYANIPSSMLESDDEDDEDGKA